MRVVDETEYKKVKARLRYSKNFRVISFEFKRSLATIMRVYNSKNFEDFQKLSRAEHPPEKPTTIGKKFNRLLAVLYKKEVLSRSEQNYVRRGNDQGIVSADQEYAQGTLDLFHNPETGNRERKSHRAASEQGKK